MYFRFCMFSNDTSTLGFMCFTGRTKVRVLARFAFLETNHIFKK